MKTKDKINLRDKQSEFKDFDELIEFCQEEINILYDDLVDTRTRYKLLRDQHEELQEELVKLRKKNKELLEKMNDQ